MNDTETAWVAGLAEGESWFGLYKGNSPDGLKACVETKMTDHDVILRLLEYSGVGVVNGPYQNNGAEHHQEYWKHSVNKIVDLQILIARILPMMGERRAEKCKKIQERFLKLIGVPQND